MVVKAASADSVTIYPQGQMSFVISSIQLYKGLYFETLGRQCELVLPVGQKLVITDLDSFEIPQELITGSLVIKTSRLPPGCEILIRGKNLQTQRSEHHKTLGIFSSSALLIGVTSNIEEFMIKTGKSGVSDLMATIQAL